MPRKKIYVAAPLFSEAELAFNAAFAVDLAIEFDIYLPQRDGQLLVQLIQSGQCVRDAAASVFVTDLEAIRACDILVIVLDGRTVDEGAAFELGFAYAIGKACFGLQTDPRRLLPLGNNPMIDRALKAIAANTQELLRLILEGET